MTGNTQLNADEARAGQIKLCDSVKQQPIHRPGNLGGPSRTTTSTDQVPASQNTDTMTNSNTEPSETYWQMRYESLRRDYDHLHKLNQSLEEKLLNVVDNFEKKREELVASAEHEKSTLMADVNKLSTKLVDARMKLHDREEKDVLHAAECAAPCHSKTTSSQVIPIIQTGQRNDPKHRLSQQQMMNDPNLV